MGGEDVAVAGSSAAYAFISFLIGVLAGFQGVYGRYKRDSLGAAFTPLGLLYLASRGVLPAAAFGFLLTRGHIEDSLIVWALVIGAGAEAFLRSKFYIRESLGADGKSEDLLYGPFDLLLWYQNLLLEHIDQSRANKRQRFVKKNLPPDSFVQLCKQVSENLDAYTNDLEDVRRKVSQLKREYAEESKGASDHVELERRYRLKLGYAVLHAAGKSGFKTLFAQD